MNYISHFLLYWLLIITTPPVTTVIYIIFVMNWSKLLLFSLCLLLLLCLYSLYCLFSLFFLFGSQLFWHCIAFILANFLICFTIVLPLQIASRFTCGRRNTLLLLSLLITLASFVLPCAMDGWLTSKRSILWGLLATTLHRANQTSMTLSWGGGCLDHHKAICFYAITGHPFCISMNRNNDNKKKMRIKCNKSSSIWCIEVCTWMYHV